jgi:hypothetical protein
MGNGNEMLFGPKVETYIRTNPTIFNGNLSWD